MLSVKPANTAHISLIRELTMQVWPQTYASILSPQQVAYMLDMMYSEAALQRQMEELHHTFLLCFDSNEPVAFASYSETEPDIYKLHKLYILAGTQGRGIGRLLVDEIVGQISGSAQSLDLNVNIYNRPAIAFYKKMGFILLRDEDIDIGGGYFMNDHVLRLKLNEL